jgi:hypothetical protein
MKLSCFALVVVHHSFLHSVNSLREFGRELHSKAEMPALYRKRRLLSLTNKKEKQILESDSNILEE